MQAYSPSYPTNAERVGSLLRHFRQTAHLSRQGLAERLGITKSRLAHWETGRHSPTMDQLDQVLAHFDVRLRLDVEKRPDPVADFAREALRLGGMTPAERLLETKCGLARLVADARTYGVESRVDGQVAAHIQGVPGRPERMQVAVLPDEVIRWLTLTWVVRFPVDEDLMPTHVPRVYAAEDFLEAGGGLLNTIYGTLRLRVVEEAPPTVRLCIQTTSDIDEHVEADVVRLDALQEHFQHASL